MARETDEEDREELVEREIMDRSGEPESYDENADWDYPPSDEKMEHYKRGGR